MVHVSEFRRGTILRELEHADKRRKTGKPGIQSNIRDTVFGIGKQFFGGSDSLLV